MFSWNSGTAVLPTVDSATDRNPFIIDYSEEKWRESETLLPSNWRSSHTFQHVTEGEKNPPHTLEFLRGFRHWVMVQNFLLLGQEQIMSSQMLQPAFVLKVQTLYREQNGDPFSYIRVSFTPKGRTMPGVLTLQQAFQMLHLKVSLETTLPRRPSYTITIIIDFK